MVKGNEEGKNDIQFGGGYSEGGGLFFQSQFATRNFLGEGENLSLSFQRGTRQNYFALSYADPWFLDTPNSLGISLFNRNTVYPISVGYQDRSRGGTIAYGYRLRRFDSLSLIYGLSRSRQHLEFSGEPDANGNLPLSQVSDFDYTTSSIGPGYHYDSRNSPYDPTAGSRISLSAAFAGGPLGGDIHEFKPSLNLTRFFPLSRRTSFSINAEAGYILALNQKNCTNSDQESRDKNIRPCVPTGERFFVGGEYSVRGFQYGDLGPKETVFGRVLNSGGYKYDVVNAEYIIKLNDPLRLVFFGDAGFSYGYKAKWDFSQTRYSTGVEFRLFLPVFQFPLRFIYAVNPAKKPGDKFQSLQFTIGNTY